MTIFVTLRHIYVQVLITILYKRIKNNIIDCYSTEFSTIVVTETHHCNVNYYYHTD